MTEKIDWTKPVELIQEPSAHVTEVKLLWVGNGPGSWACDENGFDRDGKQLFRNKKEERFLWINVCDDGQVNSHSSLEEANNWYGRRWRGGYATRLHVIKVDVMTGHTVKVGAP